MAGKSSGPNLLGNWPLMAAILVIGTYLLNPANLPFQGSRPAASGSAQLSLAETQDVDARLWQDPFAAIWKDSDRQAKSAQKIACHDGPNCLGLAPDGKTLILGVMLQGSPYPEAEELRRQIRYAILSSLGTSDYVPADPEHIGYFAYDAGSPQESTSGSPAKISTNIGFEELLPSAASPAAGRLFVLWINEDDLITMAKGCPIGGLSALEGALLAGQAASARKVVFLGPFASTTLNAMVTEASQKANCPMIAGDRVPQGYGLTLYNFAATADEKLLNPGGKELGSLLQDAGVAYYRTIADDSQLARVIAGELERRLADPQTHPNDHVLLVSEWDSFYGRTLPTSLIKQFGGSACPLGAASPDQRFHCFSYMRGLDGQLPDGTASDAKDGANASKGGAGSEGVPKSPDQILASLAPSKSIERPYGNGQYDYLRRLGLTIQQLDGRLRKEGTGKITAVGVVGSDVYDKLIVLQLLRPQFPEAVFFTTDLDARLYHPAEAERTRNLIVASAFGLELRPEWQGHIPPFRTSYQTSAFLTTRLVLEDREKETPPSNPEWVNHPVLFQIPYGQLSAYALPAEESQRPSLEARSCPQVQPMRSCGMVGPQIPDLFPNRPKLFETRASFVAGSAGSLLLAAMLFGMGLTASRGLRAAVLGDPATSAKEMKSIWTVLVLLLVVLPLSFLAWDGMRTLPMWNGAHGPIVVFGAGSVTAGLVAWRRRSPVASKSAKSAAGTRVWLIAGLFLAGGALYYSAWPAIGMLLTSDGFGEPILFLSGISIWPSIFIRMLNVGLGVWFIGYATWKLDRNFNAIARRFHVPHLDLEGADGVSRQIWKTLRSSTLRDYIHMFSYRVHHHKPCQMTDLWTAYREKEKSWARLLRVIIATSATALLFFMLVAIFGNPQPVMRGTWLQMLNWILSWVEGAVIWFLIFFVADATLYCAGFVNKIRRISYEWPIHTLRQYAEALNLHPDYLDDWIDMEFIAWRTDCINKLVYLPFMMLALVIISRSNVFDYFPPNWPVLSMTTLGFLIVLICALALPWEAEEERKTAVRKLSEYLIKIKGEAPDSSGAAKDGTADKRAASTGSPLLEVAISRESHQIKSQEPFTDDIDLEVVELRIHEAGAQEDQTAEIRTWKPPKPDQIEALLRMVEQLSKGAFTPFTQQPVGWTLLLPLSGLGGSALLQYFALPGF